MKKKIINYLHVKLAQHYIVDLIRLQEVVIHEKLRQNDVETDESTINIAQAHKSWKQIMDVVVKTHIIP